jgi:hypothetical protein
MHLLYHAVSNCNWNLISSQQVVDRTGVTAIVQARIMKILGSNLHFDTKYSEIFRNFLKFIHAYCGLYNSTFVSHPTFDGIDLYS